MTCQLFLLYIYFSGDDKTARKILKWLRKDVETAEKELQEIKTVSNKSGEETLFLLDLWRPPYQWQVKTTLSLMVFQQATGMMVIMSFANLIFKLSDCEEYSRIGSISLGISNVACAFITGKLLMSRNRKELISLSSKIVITAFLILSSFIWARTSSGMLYQFSESIKFTPLVALLLCSIGFSVGWGPVPFVFLGEGLTPKVRGIASSLAMATNSATGFIVIKLFSVGINLMGPSGVFLVHAIITYIGMNCMRNLMPETKDKTILEMSEIYEKDAIKWYENRIKKLT